MEYLMLYKFLNRVQIMRLLDLKHINQHNVVVGDLYKFKYIEKIYMPRVHHTVKRKPEWIGVGNVIYMTPLGAKFMEREQGVNLEAIGWKKIKPFSSANHYPHRMKMTDFEISLDDDFIKYGLPFDLKKWYVTDLENEKIDGQFIRKTKMSTDDKESHIIPDMAFCIQTPHTQKEALFFAEVDTAKETIKGSRLVESNTIEKKYKVYNQIWRERVFKDRFNTTAEAFRVLTITKDLEHLQSIREKTSMAVDYPEMFLLTTHEYIKSHGVMFAPIWYNLDPNQPDPKPIFDYEKFKI